MHEAGLRPDVRAMAVNLTSRLRAVRERRALTSLARSRAVPSPEARTPSQLLNPTPDADALVTQVLPPPADPIPDPAALPQDVPQPASFTPDATSATHRAEAGQPAEPKDPTSPAGDGTGEPPTNEKTAVDGEDDEPPFAKALSFMKPFDREAPDLTEDFDGFVDDIFWSHMDGENIVSVDGTNTLNLEVDLGNDRTIQIKIEKIERATDTLRFINLQCIENGIAQEGYTYMKNRNGQVVRRNEGNASEKVKEAKELENIDLSDNKSPGEWSPEASIAQSQSIIDLVEAQWQFLESQAEQGKNFLPFSAQELQGLKEFIETKGQVVTPTEFVKLITRLTAQATGKLPKDVVPPSDADMDRFYATRFAEAQQTVSNDGSVITEMITSWQVIPEEATQPTNEELRDIAMAFYGIRRGLSMMRIYQHKATAESAGIDEPYYELLGQEGMPAREDVERELQDNIAFISRLHPNILSNAIVNQAFLLDQEWSFGVAKKNILKARDGLAIINSTNSADQAFRDMVDQGGYVDAISSAADMELALQRDFLIDDIEGLSPEDAQALTQAMKNAYLVAIFGERVPHVTLDNVGEGEEFRVVRPSDREGIVYKVPKETHAWADADVSISTYQEQMYERLRDVEGFEKYLPAQYRKIEVEGLGEVIEAEDLTAGGRNLVVSLDQIESMAIGENPQLEAELQRFPLSREQITSLKLEVTDDLLGKPGSAEGGLLDSTSVQHIAIPQDSLHIIITPDGTIRVVISDFGTVSENNDMQDAQNIGRTLVINLNYALNTLKNHVESRPRQTSAESAREVFGLATTDNSGPEQVVRRIFGIDQSDLSSILPALVVITPENKDTIISLRDRGTYFGSLDMLDDPYAAWHDIKHNIVFMGINAYQDEPEIRIHETAHPIISFLNPEFTRAKLRRIEAFESLFDPEPSTVNLKETAIAELIMEGCAKFLEVAFLDTPEKQRLAQNLLLTGRTSSDEVTVNSDWLNLNFALLDLSIIGFQQALDRKDFNLQKNALDLEKEVKYVIGYHFFYMAIKQMSDKYASFEELQKTLVGLIQNPPQTLDELKDPVAYMQQLQAKLASPSGDPTIQQQN